MFDNTEFERRTPEEWTSDVGDNEYSSAKALRKKKHSINREWKVCFVKSYNQQTSEYVVQWKNDNTENNIPRIELIFDCENPFDFRDRLVFAHETRRTFESYLRYTLYVDNMPIEDIPPIKNEFIQRIMKKSKNFQTKKEMNINKLLEEINLEWKRSMNKILFDDCLEKKEF
eukprot:UN32964